MPLDHYDQQLLALGRRVFTVMSDVAAARQTGGCEAAYAIFDVHLGDGSSQFIVVGASAELRQAIHRAAETKFAVRDIGPIDVRQ